MAQEMQLFHLLCLSLVLIKFCSGGNGDTQRNDINDAVQTPTPPSVTKSLNDTVDLLLDVLQETLVKTNHTAIPIPDFEEQFIKKIGRIKIKGKISAKNGWFKNLSTVHRIGDATMTQSGRNLTVDVGVGLGFMQLGYDYIQVKVEAMRMTGNLTVNVLSNSVFVQVGVEMSQEGKCNLTLQELKITQLDGLQVHVHGLKKTFDWLVSQIATIVTLRMKDQIRTEIETHVSSAAQEAMSKFHC